MLNEGTIIAKATASGSSAISIIRISGVDSIKMVSNCFKAKSGKILANQKSHTIHFGTIYDKDRAIDEVLVSLFIGPNSYTGENIVEISCHGSIYIQQQIFQLFINEGAKPAKPGEYTLRAFLNQKIDLILSFNSFINLFSAFLSAKITSSSEKSSSSVIKDAKSRSFCLSVAI